MKSIGFIGAGNMGYALAKAVAHRFPEVEIHVYDTKPERIELFRKELCKAHPCGSTAEVAKAAEAVFLAVKPQDYSTVLPQIRATRCSASYRLPAAP